MFVHTEPGSLQAYSVDKSGLRGPLPLTPQRTFGQCRAQGSKIEIMS